MKYLLYGANGYSGQLIARMAARYGLQPILAGRNAEGIRALAAALGLEHRAFALDEPDKIDENLRDVALVLHAAGPFAHTAQPMMEACLRNRCHYLDITGEIAVFEMAHGYDAAARAAGIMLMSGTGFDVVPTDCTALALKEQLPDATHLKLAFANIGGTLSHGTALTMLEGLGKPGAERKNGQIVAVPLGRHSWDCQYEGRTYHTVSIPWGDVSTAWYSTGIPNIVTFTRGKRRSPLKRWLQNLGMQLLARDWMKARLRQRILAQPPGPDDAQRQKARSIVWGEARNAQGETASTCLSLPEGYTLTAMSSLYIAREVLEGRFQPGFQTPAMAYGAGLIQRIVATSAEI
jgi:short subunit dehydrogenase-like uncharacterized protein